MTANARVVLDDCKGALAELIDGIQGASWRRRWVTCVVLLRAVGHVLQKVDGQNDPILREEIDTAFSELKRSKPEPQIFWEFIDCERNSILKEYEINAGQGVHLRSGEETRFVYKINSGRYKGFDQREVVSQAISWWSEYLGSIDAAVERRRMP